MLDDGSPESPFALFKAEDNIESIKKHANVFHSILRRYKYLQKNFEETMKNIIQQVNRWSPSDRSKLSKAVAIFITIGLLPMQALLVMTKEHLVKDGLSLAFVTPVFRVTVDEIGIERFAASLRKDGVEGKLMEFFPINRRTEADFAAHFTAEGLGNLVEYHNKKQNTLMKDLAVENIKNMIDSEASPSEIAAYLHQTGKENKWTEQNLAMLGWDAIVGAVDWSARPEVIESQILRQLNQFSNVLESVTTASKTEIVLLQHIQIHCYENAKLMKHFRQILQLLYKADVLSGNAIVYWAEKAAKPQGKTLFLKQTEPFVRFLKESPDDDSDSEEEDDN